MTKPRVTTKDGESFTRTGSPDIGAVKRKSSLSKFVLNLIGGVLGFVVTSVGICLLAWVFLW